MKRSRLVLVAVTIILSAAAAFAVRDMIYDLVILPLSYLLWQIRILMGAVPELVRWVFIVLVAGLVVAWQLVPDLRPLQRGPGKQRAAAGQVEEAANWLLRSRASNYFKWQLAHRLGRVARRLEELAGGPQGESVPAAAVSRYLAAGMDHSFVDFPSPRLWFGRRTATPLDLDPNQVVEHLEAQGLTERERHANGL